MKTVCRSHPAITDEVCETDEKQLEYTSKN